jgi:preprotein translocase subunit SecE
MAGIKTYIEEAVDELKNKVSWPTWQELQGSSLVVLIATFIIAILIYVMDLGSSNVLKQIYKLFN